MLLRVSFVPPDALVRELESLVARLEQLPGVEPVPRDRLEVPVVRLSHLEAADARRLLAELEPAVAAVPAPAAHLEGLRLLPSTRGSVVAVNLAGDLPGVHELVHAIGRSVEATGLTPDHPVFHPCVALARISASLPGALGAAEQQIEHWLGSSWPMREVCVAQVTDGGLSGGRATVRPLAWLPVGSRVPAG